MLEQKPLDGLRVLDLTRVLAGPFCTMTLADLGAEIIKIELPGVGDDSRRFPPMIPDSTDSAYFYAVNRGKQSLSLDLRQPAGAEILLALVAKADLVVENFAPGTMERFKLGYERLREANPRIILCSISGFGQSGPMASEPAYDIVAQALGGTMSVTGEAGAAPTRCGVSIGDMTAALYAVIAIFAALRLRDHSGVGEHLDIAMLDCQVAMLETSLGQYCVTGKIPGPIGTRHPVITPFQQFRAQGEYFVIGVGNESLWRSFCDAIGRPELPADPRFGDNPSRTRHHPELEALLMAHFDTQPRAYWLERLHAAAVPCAPVANVAEVARNPHLLQRQMILRAEHPSFPDLLVPGSPLKIAGAVPPTTRAPQLGEDTEQLLATLLGYDAARIAQLRAAHVI